MPGGSCTGSQPLSNQLFPCLSACGSTSPVRHAALHTPFQGARPPCAAQSASHPLHTARDGHDQHLRFRLKDRASLRLLPRNRERHGAGAGQPMRQVWGLGRRQRQEESATMLWPGGNSTVLCCVLPHPPTHLAVDWPTHLAHPPGLLAFITPSESTYTMSFFSRVSPAAMVRAGPPFSPGHLQLHGNTHSSCSSASPAGAALHGKSQAQLVGVYGWVGGVGTLTPKQVQHCTGAAQFIGCRQLESWLRAMHPAALCLHTLQCSRSDANRPSTRFDVL